MSSDNGTWVIPDPNTPNRPKGKTHGVFVLDRSSSMGKIRDVTITGFNEWLDGQKNGPDELMLTLVLFNTEVKVPFKDTPIERVNHINRERYVPDGFTALYDAIAYGCEAIEPFMRPEDRALVVVLTDGQENASKNYRTASDIRHFITNHERRGNWTFTYLSSDADAWRDAADMGIQRGNTAVFEASDVGMRSAMHSANVSTQSYRGAAGQSVSDFYAPDKSEPDDNPATDATIKQTKTPTP